MADDCAGRRIPGQDDGAPGYMQDITHRLRSADPAERELAWAEFEAALGEDAVLPADTAFFSSSSAVVSLLLDLLADSGYADRGRALESIQYVLQESLDPGYEDRELLQIVSDRLELLLGLAESGGPSSLLAPAILGLLIEQADAIAPRLHALLATRPDADQQVLIVLALSSLLGMDSAAQALFASALRLSDGPASVLAAIALIERAREHAPENAIRIVADWIAAYLAGGLGQLVPYHILIDADELSAALVALARLERDRALQLLLSFLHPIDYQRSGALETVARLLLGLAWNCLSLSDPYQILESARASDDPIDLDRVAVDFVFTPEQRRVLQALADSDAFWRLSPNPLAELGLPDHRGLLRHLLAGPVDLPSPAPPFPAYPRPADAGPDLGDAAPRIAQIEATMRGRIRPAPRQVIIDYLRGSGELKDVWMQGTEVHNAPFQPSDALLLSDQPYLDPLDLRLLEVYWVLGYGAIYLEAVGREARAVQAFVHMRQLQPRHPYPSLAHSAFDVLAASQDSLVVEGRPTPLGAVVLAGLPASLDDILRLRKRFRHHFPGNAADLIDLLLCADPPYLADAMRVLRQAQAD